MRTQIDKDETHVGAMPLAMIETGKKVKFLCVRSGRALKAPLAALGFFLGVELEVMRNNCHRPFIVAIKGGRMVLGRGMAQKILVVYFFCAHSLERLTFRVFPKTLEEIAP